MKLGMIYGTAWKEDETARLTQTAIEAGFFAIDTANQRKHYFEAAVGEAIRDAGAQRSTLFLQTKFTPLDGQDHRLPYDPSADIHTQVHQSFSSSLEHLGTDYIDSYVLHGPYSGRGLIEEDWQAWGAMEELHAEGCVRALGVSNVNLEQLEALCESAKVPPRFVQNRCYARSGWDARVRAFCAAHGILYQGFSLLTANRYVLDGPVCRKICARAGCTPAQAVFRFALGVGMLPLTGTTSLAHMKEDLVADKVALTEEEIEGLLKVG